MSNLTGKRVLITGGASGIGKIMGQIVLQRGAELIIWDIDQVKNNETLTEFKKLGVVHGYQVDVSNREQVNETAMLVREHNQRILCGEVARLEEERGEDVS